MLRPKEQLNTRTLKPDGERIKQMRVANGWRVEDLARKASCSCRTVDNVEKGADVYLVTLSKIAKALGVEVQSLVINSAPAPPQHAAGETRVVMQVNLSINISEFDETDELKGLLQQILSLIAAKSEVGVISVEPGSVVIRLEMSATDALALMQAHEDGLLESLSVNKVDYMPSEQVENAQPMTAPVPKMSPTWLAVYYLVAIVLGIIASFWMGMSYATHK